MPDAPDTDDDIFGADGCRPVLARFVVLGDSIAQCIAERPEVCPKTRHFFRKCGASGSSGSQDAATR